MSTTTTDSPEKGIAASDGIDEGVLTGIRRQLKGTISDEQLDSLMESSFPKEWIEDRIKASENLIKDPSKYIKETTAEEKAKGKTKETADPTHKEEEPKARKKAKVEFEIDPEELGTYAVNRDAKEAVLEALKGLGHKDRTIKEQKAAILEYESKISSEKAERQKLLDELATFKKGTVAPIKAAELKEIELPEPPTPPDGDYLDSEYQKQFREYQIKVREAYLAEKENNKVLRSRIDEADGKAKTVVEKIAKQEAVEQRTNQIEDELSEIDRIRKTNEKGIFNYKRQFKAIENDYLNFLREVYVAIGGKDGVLVDDTGHYKPEIMKAADTYFDKTEGKELRDRIKAANAEPPEELDELNRVYGIRAIRESKGRNSEGKYVLSYDEAQDLYTGRNTDLTKVRLQAAKEGQEAFERAKNNRKEFARETTAANSTVPIDLSKLDQARAEKIVGDLVRKGHGRTAEETETLKYLLKEAGGMDDKEINGVLSAN